MNADDTMNADDRRRPTTETRPAGAEPGTVLFLHGLGTTAGMWAGHTRLLPEFVCVCPDLPGHGTAAGPWVSLAGTAAEVATVIEATPQRRAHVVGLSLGGAVAIELMNTRPELLDRVLIDGASGVTWRCAPLLAAVAAGAAPWIHSRPFMRTIAQVLSIRADRRPDFYREMRMVDPASFRRSVRDWLGARLENFGYPRPVLLVAGGHDVGATRVSNATLAAALPDAAAWFVPGTWHAWAGTNPELHKAMVRAFLTGAPVPAGLVPETSRPRRAITPVG